MTPLINYAIMVAKYGKVVDSSRMSISTVSKPGLTQNKQKIRLVLSKKNDLVTDLFFCQSFFYLSVICVFNNYF